MGARHFVEHQKKPTVKPRNLSREKAVIDAVCDWLVEYAGSKLDEDQFQSNLHTFRSKLNSTLKRSLDNIHCANLRTTAEDSKLYAIAESCNIPSYALPENLSIVLTQESAYYFRKKSSVKNFIIK